MTVEIMKLESLHFHGPFKFTKGEKYLFNSDFIKSEGIYIWTIKDEKNNINYIQYIGETSSFGKRQREHLIQITGLNYRIIDPDLARQGIEKIIWKGMWRDKSPDAVSTLLDNFDEVSKKVTGYIGLINVYFAPANVETHIRRHIEGCIAWNLRNKYPELKVFYPDDNLVRTMAQRIGKKIGIFTDEEIAGIDNELII